MDIGGHKILGIQHVPGQKGRMGTQLAGGPDDQVCRDIRGAVGKPQYPSRHPAQLGIGGQLCAATGNQGHALLQQQVAVIATGCIGVTRQGQ